MDFGSEIRVLFSWTTRDGARGDGEKGGEILGEKKREDGEEGE